MRSMRRGIPIAAMSMVLLGTLLACGEQSPSTLEPSIAAMRASGNDVDQDVGYDVDRDVDSASALSWPATLAASTTLASLRLAPRSDTLVQGQLGGQATVKVVVSDTTGRLMHNAVVIFQPAAGHGAMSRATVNTNLTGEATNTWRFGPAVGAQTLRVWIQGAPDTLIFTATLPGPYDVSAVSSAAFTGTYAGNAVVTVLVVDSLGNPFQSASVNFTPDTNAGTVAYPVVRSNNRGEAKVTWTFSTRTVGDQRLRVTVDGLTDTLVFVADVEAPPVAVTLQSMTDSSLTGIIGGSRTLSVLVRDQRGQPLPKASVTFRALTGSGTVLPSPAVSGKTGVANATWTFARQAGTQTVLVTAQGIDDTLRFVATVKAPPAATALVAVSDTNVNGRTGESTVLQVRVLDADGDPFPNAAVKFKVLTGRGSMQTSVVKSGRDGLAKGTWYFGGVLGDQQATAEVVNVTGTTLTFTGDVSVGAPKVVTAASATSGRAVVGDTLSTAPTVKVTDNYGNPVPGVTVLFRVTAGGGSIQHASVITSAGGLASGGAWILGPVVGPQRVTATVQAPVAKGNPVVFAATAAASP